MDSFLEMPLEERRRLCREAEARRGLRAASIEKDFWICSALRELFALDGIGAHLTFKGGTSLSKGWKLIERFSEDLDVTVSRAYLGFGGDEDPAVAGSVTQRNRRVEQLRERCAGWVEHALMPALLDRFETRLTAEGRWQLALDVDDAERLTLLFESMPGATGSPSGGVAAAAERGASRFATVHPTGAIPRPSCPPAAANGENSGDTHRGAPRCVPLPSSS